MSDPFSMTGSAVGVISLGISVCGGLLDYYRSWKGIDDDATRICEYIDDLNGTLEVLQAIIQRDDFRGESRRLVDERVVSCAAAARELDNVWKKFRDVPNSPKAKYRISNYFKRSCYPFQEPTLSKIRANASELRDNLSLAVGILNTEITADNKHTLTELRSSLGQASQDTARISQRLDDCSRDIQRVDDNVSTIGTGLQLTELSIQNRLERLPSDTAVALRNDLLLASDRIQTQISTLLDQSARQQQDQFKAMQSDLAALRSLQLKIVSKPSLTRDVCDSFDSLPVVDSQRGLLSRTGPFTETISWGSDYLLQRGCTCRKKSSFNLLSLFSLELGFEFRHLKSCPLRTQSDTKIKGRLRVRPPRWILARSISATFSASLGAGGFSLEPVFMVQHVVDWETFPSFRAISTFLDSIQFAASDEYQIETTKFVGQLSQLSESGLCSPLLVDEYGGNILEHFAQLSYIPLDSVSCQHQKRLLEVLDFLISRLHIPLTGDIIESILKVESMRFLNEPITSTYLRHEYDRSRRDDIVLSMDRWSGSCLHLLSDWSEIIKDLEYGPVTRAVVERSLFKLDALIREGYSLNEKTLGQRSVLHLAVGWPPGLQRLLDTGLDPSPLDLEAALPLHYAIDANCYESAQLLIVAGSQLSILPKRPLWVDRVWVHTWERCSKPLMRIVITALAQQRRDYLVELKQKLLQGSSLELPYPTDRLVPDEVTMTLAILADIDTAIWRPRRGRVTVFHDDLAWQSPTTELLFAEGFRDINSYDRKGLTPLMLACSQIGYEDVMHIIKWLLDKDCDPLCFDALDTTTSFHIFAGHLNAKRYLELIPYFLAASSSPTRRRPSELFWTCWRTYSLEGRKQEAIDPRDYQDILTSKYRSYQIDKTNLNPEGALSHIEATSRLIATRDRCQCACAPDGCTATTKLFSHRPEYVRCKISLENWCSSFNLGSGDLIGMIHREYIRLRAFDKLGITHVCCSPDWYSPGFRKRLGSHQEESEEARLEIILEIQEEESELIERLETFMEWYDEAFAHNEGPVMEFVELWERRIQEEDEEFLWSFPLRGDGASEMSPSETFNDEASGEEGDDETSGGHGDE